MSREIFTTQLSLNEELKGLASAARRCDFCKNYDERCSLITRGAGCEWNFNFNKETYRLAAKELKETYPHNFPYAKFYGKT